MLSTPGPHGIGIADDPLSPYVHPDWSRQARIVAQAAVCEALGDRLAWHLIVGEEGALAAHRSVYGNRKGKGRGSRRR
jgi:hypothetical protein